MLVRLLVALIAGMTAASAATPLSTYFARGRSFSPIRIATDANGNVYIAGNTQLDVFLTKLDSDFHEVYTVVWGGTSGEEVHGLAIGPTGDVYVTGSTNSPDFPVDATQSALRGDGDGFVTKLNANGGFVFSTYLGGTDRDNITAIAVDQDGSAYLTGDTLSHDFPVTSGAFQTTFVPRNPFATPYAAFVAKLTPTGRISYATFLAGTRTVCQGGSSCLSAIARSWGYAIAVDATGSAYIAGSTNSLDFPVTTGAFNSSCTCTYGAGDAFVTKLNPAGSALVFSTYFAAGPSPITGGFGEEVHDLAVDSTGNVYAAGTTHYATFPTTPGSLHPQPNLTSTDVALFAFKLAAGGDRLLYSTYLNDGGSASIAGLQVDPQGNFVLAGTSLTAAIPATSGAPGNGTGFLAKLNPQGSAWNYVARLPAGSADRGLTLSASGDALVAGSSGFLSRSTPDGAGYKMPLILGVANAAGVSISPLIAPYEIISIYGVGIGPAQNMGARLVNGAQVDSELGGTRVLINGTPAPLTFAGPNQINAVIPSRQLLNENTAPLQITRDGQNIAAINLWVREPLPEVFLTGEVVLNSYIAAALNEDGTINSKTNPAKPNSIVSVFATGLGSMAPTLQDGAIVTNISAARLVTNVRVVVARDTLAAELLYAGQAPGLIAGAIQLNFRLPDLFDGVASFNLEAGAARSTQFGVYIKR
ncbi:MAG: SBBP repeat-containing protein [Bryobacteraceae bacterium]